MTLCWKSRSGYQFLETIATTAVEAKKFKPKISINNLHTILGHCGKVAAKMTEKRFGYVAMGNYKTCVACSVAKIRGKNINNDWKGSNITPGEMLYTDSPSREKTMVGRNYGR
jgi:hypothetical protein